MKKERKDQHSIKCHTHGSACLFSLLSRWHRGHSFRSSSMVNMKFQLCILKTVQMNVEIDIFGVINPLNPSPLGKVELLTSSRPSHRVLNLYTKFQLCILETVQMHVEFAIFGVINPIFPSPLVHPRNADTFTTCQLSQQFLN